MLSDQTQSSSQMNGPHLSIVLLYISAYWFRPELCLGITIKTLQFEVIVLKNLVQPFCQSLTVKLINNLMMTAAWWSKTLWIMSLQKHRAFIQSVWIKQLLSSCLKQESNNHSWKRDLDSKKRTRSLNLSIVWM